MRNALQVVVVGSVLGVLCAVIFGQLKYWRGPEGEEEGGRDALLQGSGGVGRNFSNGQQFVTYIRV